MSTQCHVHMWGSKPVLKTFNSLQGSVFLERDQQWLENKFKLGPAGTGCSKKLCLILHFVTGLFKHKCCLLSGYNVEMWVLPVLINMCRAAGFVYMHGHVCTATVNLQRGGRGFVCTFVLCSVHYYVTKSSHRSQSWAHTLTFNNNYLLTPWSFVIMVFCQAQSDSFPLKGRMETGCVSGVKSWPWI